MTMKMKTGISPEYVKNWDAAKAIREIVQNYLDSRKEFNCDGKIEWKDGKATVKDYGPGILPKHLALGVSEKSSEAIGKYGEGLKLALLVMAREKRHIEIWAHGKIIRPVIEYDEAFQTEVMNLIIDDMKPRHAATHKGTSIKFECTEEELRAGKLFFMNFLVKEQEFEWMDRGKISLPGGFVFVNGAMVGSLEGAMFSYHFKESTTGDIGNRDREVVDGNKVINHVRWELAKTRSNRVMEAILNEIKEGRTPLEIKHGVNHYAICGSRKKLWKKTYNSVFGKDTVISSNKGEQYDTEAKYKGYNILRVDDDWRYMLKEVGVKTTDEMVTAGKQTTNEVKRHEITNEQLKNLKLAESIISECYKDTDKVKLSEDLTALAGVSSQSDVVNGLYQTKKDVIWLRTGILDDLNQTIHTLLHEAVHKHTGANDCTAFFERMLTDVSVAMMVNILREKEEEK